MLITNANIITWENPNRILENHALYIDNGIIVEVDSTLKLVQKYPDEQILDACSQYVMPGNICAHTHFYGAFARGMAIAGDSPKDFPDILNQLWWSLDKSLRLEDVKLSAQVCLLDAVRHGTTTLIDHHASPNAIEGSLDQIADTVLASGLRASLCYEVTDRDGMDKSEAGIQENVRFINRVKMDSGFRGKISATFGLHASLTLSDRTLDRCRQVLPEGYGIHIHVAEHPVDEYDSLKKAGTRVINRLNQHGLLGTESIIVHAVHIDAEEVRILRENHCWVTHQPRSNMNNAVGLPEVQAMLRSGIRVCLGNDGFSNQMWEEWKAAYLAHKLWHHDPRFMPANEIAQMAIYNNADLAASHFDGVPIGKLIPGARADMIFVDYHPFTDMNPLNLPWHIVFGFHESMITTTIANGEVLMKDRELQTMDEEKIIADARQASARVWERYNHLHQ